MDKKKLISILSFALVIVLGVAVGLIVGLSGGEEDTLSSSSTPSTENSSVEESSPEEDYWDSSKEIIWVDGADPDPEAEKDPEITSPKVVYPQKPEAEPVIDTTLPTTIGSLSVSDECYTLQTEGQVKLSYDSIYNLPAFAYMYIPVENYHSKYSYLKIKANCVGVQKIAIVAVYYEQYDANRPGVTVYNNAVKEGDNVIICDLNECTVLDFDYRVATGEKLTQKKIVGFMVFVDSNPKQVIDDFTGEMTFTEIAVVDSTDSDLEMLNSAPTISGWSQSDVDVFGSCNITTSNNQTTGGVDAIIDYEFTAGYPYAVAQIFNYKKEYTSIKMTLKGENVRNLSIAIKYSLSTVSGAPGYNYLVYGMDVPTEYETFEFDFSTLGELNADFSTVVPGSYVKDLKPIAIYFYLDSADLGTGTASAGGDGVLHVKDIEFVKVVDDGTPKVTTTWSLMADSGISKSNVEAGGIGTLTYNKTQGWNAVTLNVSSYNPEYTVLVVRVKFYGAKNLGIALGYGSGNTVIQNSDGQTTANVTLTHTQENGSDEKGDYVFHTYTIDFTNVSTINSQLLSEQPISNIYFYIDSVKEVNGVYQEVGAGGTLANERAMQFVGITFEKPATDE